MAVKSSETENKFNPAQSPLTGGAVPAGIVSILFLLAGVAAMIVYALQQTSPPGWLIPVIVGKVIFSCLLIGVGIQLIRRRAWAQQVLLIFWMIAIADSLLVLIGMMMWGVGEFWKDMMIFPLEIVCPVVLGASVIAAWLLVRASSRVSRLRYASVVAISIVAALIVAVVVNMISQDKGNYWRKDVETLGRYGISGRTRRILSDVKDKLTLTCVYTSSDNDKLPEDYRPRVVELLEDIREAMGSDATVVNVTTVAQKARLDARLRKQLAARQGEHVKLLKEFIDRGGQMAAGLKKSHQQWAKMPADAYLTTWGITAKMADILKKSSEKMEKARQKVGRELKGSDLPDYAALIEEVVVVLEQVRQPLEGSISGVNKIREIPRVVARRKAKALQALKQVEIVADTMLKSLGQAEGEKIQDPSKVLAMFATNARKTSLLTRKAAMLLADIAGKEFSALVRSSSCYAVYFQYGQHSIRRELVEVLMQNLAEPLSTMAYNADQTIKNTKPAFQIKTIKRIQEKVAGQVAQFKSLHELAVKAIDKLSVVDKPTQVVFDAAKQGTLFKSLIKSISDLMARAEKLPKVEKSTLTSDIAKDNIVIIEVAGKIRIATFEDIWPIDMSGMEVSPDAKPKRLFNGDSALGSKILSMTHEPFATVLLTYYQPKIPPRLQQMLRYRPQMARAIPYPPLPPYTLTTLRSALIDANFKVEQWNLAGAKPKLDDKLKTVMLVLPPPPPASMQLAQFGISAFGQKQIDLIRSEIDGGTPAVFLAMFLPAQTRQVFGREMKIPQYQYIGNYLRKAWGIDVRNSHRVIKGVADKAVSGRFKIDGKAFDYLPISTFSPDHSISHPLQGQRVLWLHVCPMEIMKDVPNVVKAEPLLSVPAGSRDIWATDRVGEIIAKIRAREEGGFLTPNYKDGDLRTPMDLAIAARRTGDKKNGSKESRIVVLGVGMSMIDGYIDRPIFGLDTEGGAGFDDPPKANADLVINSVYWLIGRENFIAAGPAKGKPIAQIGTNAETMLKILYIGILPLIVLIIGGLVMVARKR